jgi:hypothetical protein
MHKTLLDPSITSALHVLGDLLARLQRQVYNFGSGSRPGADTIPMRLVHHVGHLTISTRWNTFVLVMTLLSQPVEIFPAVYATRMFVTVYTPARHLSVSGAS